MGKLQSDIDKMDRKRVPATPMSLHLPSLTPTPMPSPSLSSELMSQGIQKEVSMVLDFGSESAHSVGGISDDIKVMSMDQVTFEVDDMDKMDCDGDMDEDM